MNLLLKIAFRNMLRNLRRSLMTGSAVAAGALALTARELVGTLVRLSCEADRLEHRQGAATPLRLGHADQQQRVFNVLVS